MATGFGRDGVTGRRRREAGLRVFGRIDPSELIIADNEQLSRFFNDENC